MLVNNIGIYNIYVGCKIIKTYKDKILIYTIFIKQAIFQIRIKSEKIQKFFSILMKFFNPLKITKSPRLFDIMQISDH